MLLSKYRDNVGTMSVTSEVVWMDGGYSSSWHINALSSTQKQTPNFVQLGWFPTASGY